MKKLFSLAVSLFFAAMVMGQSPVITFDKTTHDFGKINEADGRVTTVFTFVNEGTTPLVLSNVRASCGCTTPKWTREPIEPGQSGDITVTYNPSGRPGRFQKTVTVTSNATEATTKLYIKGEVIPKTAPNPYVVKMGALSLKRRSVSFGSVVQGSTPKTLEIEYTNQGNETINLDLLIREQDAHFKPELTVKTLAPKEVGKILITLAADESPLLGPINTKMYVVINGKRDMSEKFAIGLNANIREDFSKLTVEERQQAPIVEIEKEVNLGTIKLGKKISVKLPIANVGGGNPLYIRRIILDDPMVSVVAPKSAIKAGRKGDIKLELNATDTTIVPAAYSRLATIITNDPNKPVSNIKITWTVE